MKGKTRNLIANLIRSNGIMTCADIHDETGLSIKRQHEALKFLLASGAIVVEKVASASRPTTGVRGYRWIGEAAPQSDATHAKTRACLCCGRPFHSSFAGNRICPDCKKTASRASGAGQFDTPATIRYR